MQAARMTFKEEVIKLRLERKSLGIAHTNLKKRNETLSQKIPRLEVDNSKLREQNRVLKQENTLFQQKQQEQERKIESLQLIVEELRRIVFGEKSKKSDDTNSEGTNTSGEKSFSTQKRKSANRSKESYRRARPKEEEVNDTIEHPLTNCPDCGTLLIALKTIIRYVEDLQDLTELHTLLKRIEKHMIQTGYCPKCKKRKTAAEISPQVCILGENVKKIITYLVIIMRHSFEQVRQFLSDTADLSISDGEIVAALDEQAGKLTPERNRIFQRIRGSPGSHYDETVWKVQTGELGNYCWIKRPTIGEETIFLMGRSRGKGNAEELRGAIDNQTGITDDYAAYDHLFAKHQLCMGHPHRKLRDLAESKILAGVTKAACIKSFEEFSNLYADLEETMATEYKQDVWLQKREEYIQRLQEIAIKTTDDPEKLRAIKQSLTQNAERYFTCLLEEGIPADNNKAERGLRHIVLKRKISYGSKSQKGAETMSILCSTLLSCWWNKPKNFFVAYNQMLTS